jgi:hypothetical protein
MSKKEFLIQYVLNRALIVGDILNSEGSVEAAIKAWELIKEKTKGDK